MSERLEREEPVSVGARPVEEERAALEQKLDIHVRGIRIELHGVRDDLNEAIALSRGVAAVIGRLDRERENDRKALVDIAESIMLLRTSGRVQSGSDFDAQAISATIEHLHSQHRGDMAALAVRFARVERELGVAPNAALEIKGSGALGMLAELHSARSVAVIAIGTFLAGAGAIAGILKAIGLLGGH